jgi:hypothetical protein
VPVAFLRPTFRSLACGSAQQRPLNRRTTATFLPETPTGAWRLNGLYSHHESSGLYQSHSGIDGLFLRSPAHIIDPHRMRDGLRVRIQADANIEIILRIAVGA